MHARKDPRGFSLIEMVLAIALAGIFLTASAGGLIYGLRSAKDAGRKIQAMYLADEGLAALQNLRDEQFTNLVDGTWGLAVSGGQWALSGTSDSVGDFQRSLIISSVDAATKQITSTVSWTNTRGILSDVTLVSYLTDWLTTTLQPWVVAITAGVLDLAGNQDLVKVATVENYAYALREVNGSSNFVVLDITNAVAPTQVATLNLNGTPSNIAISGQYAYVSSSHNSEELQIVSLATPTAPTQVRTYDAAGNANATSVAIVGSTVVLVREKSGDPELLTLDVTTPTSPVLLGGLDVAYDLTDVAASGGFAYAASKDDAKELYVIDISAAGAPTTSLSYDAAGADDGASIALNGSTLLLGAGSTIYVLEHGTSLTLGSSIGLGGIIHDISMAFGQAYAFVVTNNSTDELYFVNATTPGAAMVLSTLNLDDAAKGVAYNETLDIGVVATVSNSSEFSTLSQ